MHAEMLPKVFDHLGLAITWPQQEDSSKLGKTLDWADKRYCERCFTRLDRLVTTSAITRPTRYDYNCDHDYYQRPT